MKTNTRHYIKYKEYINKETGDLIKYGYNSAGDIVYRKDSDFTETYFNAENGLITKIIKDNNIFKIFKPMTNSDIGNYISLSNLQNSSEIYTFFRPYLGDKTGWSEIRYENNGKVIRNIEIYSDGSTSKSIDYKLGTTCLYFPNGKRHVCIFPDETLVYDYTGKLAYRVINGVINKYGKSGIIKSMYKENENKIYTYPAVCAGADIRCVTYPSGLQYWYRNDKLIMKKYARGTIIMYNKKGKKDKIKYKIMSDGVKVFYNQRENPTYEIRPNGKIYKYRGGRRVNK